MLPPSFPALLAGLGLLLIPIAGLNSAPAKPAAPAQALALPATWPAHPRLIATAAEWQALAARRAADPELDAYVKALLTVAKKELPKLKPLQRTLTGRRLLGVSRTFLQRELLAAFAFRVTGDQAYFQRARQDMLDVCAFSDWNPKHFLDVAEMSAGVAFGYDWLFDQLSPEDRATIKRALIDKGLAMARNGHSTFRTTNNWAQVCAGGLSIAAMAIGDEEPALASTLLGAAKASLPCGMDAYKPDGIYPEGPGYWGYGTGYEVVLLSSLRTALGDDWGIMKQPGFARSALFAAHTLAPSGLFFDFADCGEGGGLMPPQFFLAGELGQPDLALGQKRFLAAGAGKERLSPLVVFWWPFKPAASSSQASPAQSVSTHFHGGGVAPLAIWRSSWTDPKALYFAIKGGGAAVNHGHMDGGSFVLELDGVRWAVDLGMQDYESLESRRIDLWNKSQGSQRWRVFRLGSAAHNTLTINGGLHNAGGLARLVSADELGAEIDLAPVFLDKQVAIATRRVRLGDATVSLTDTVTGAKPGASIRWAMTTRADVKIEGNKALLELGKKRLVVSFEGTGLTLSVLDISKPVQDYDAPNPAARQLIATAPADAAGSWSLTSSFARP